jgi:peptide/nickel transport system ATP-binding protein
MELRRAIQLVFQNADTSLNPRRSVAAAIGRPLRFFTGGSSRERIGDLLEQVGLPRDFQTRLPSQLSGGQRQRVGIARALAADPQVLIADEITTALDVQVQAGILDLLARLKRDRALSCLFVSHDLAVVKGIADRVAVMRQGRVVEVGPAARVFAGPNHPYTRSLLGATLEPGTMELPVIGAESSWEDDEGWIDQGGGHLIRAWRRKK